MSNKSYLRFIPAGYDGEIVSSQAPIATFSSRGIPHSLAAVLHTVVVYDLSSSTKKRTYFSTLAGRLPQPVTTLAVSADGSTFIAGYAGGHVAIWPTAPPDDLPDASMLTDADAILASTVHRPTGRVTCSAITADGALAVSGSSDTTVAVWDVGARDVLATFVGHSAPITAVAILPPPAGAAVSAVASAGAPVSADSHSRIISADAAGHLRVWSLADASCCQVIRPLAAAIACLAVSPAGDRVVVGGAADELRVLQWPVWEEGGGAFAQLGVVGGAVAAGPASGAAAPSGTAASNGDWVLGDVGGLTRRARGRVSSVYVAAAAGAGGDGAQTEVLGVVSGTSVEVFHRLPAAVAATRLSRQAARRAQSLAADADADPVTVQEAAAAAAAATAIAKAAASGAAVGLPAAAEWRPAHYGVTAPWAVAAIAPMAVRCAKAAPEAKDAKPGKAAKRKRADSDDDSSGADAPATKGKDGADGDEDLEPLPLTTRGPAGSDAFVVSLKNNVIMAYRRRGRAAEFASAGSGATVARGGHRADIRAVAVVWPSAVMDGTVRGADARACVTADSIMLTVSAATLRVFSLVPTTAAPPDDHLTVPKPSCVAEVGPLSAALYSVAALPGGVFAVVGTAAGTVAVVDIRGGAVVYESDAIHSSGSGVTAIAVRAHSGDDVEVLTGGAGDHAIRRWSVGVVDGRLGLVPRGGAVSVAKSRMKQGASGAAHSDAEGTSVDVGAGVNAIKFSQSGKYVLVALQNNNAAVLHADTLRLHVVLYGHKLPVTDIDMSHDDELIATVSVDKNLRLWGTAFGDARRSLFAHDEAITGVSFSGRTHMVWTSSRDGTLKQWDADEHAMAQIVRGHIGPVIGLAVAPTGNLLISAGSTDRSVRAWVRTSEKVFPKEEEEAERLAAADERLAASTSIVGGFRAAANQAEDGEDACATASPLDGGAADAAMAATASSLRLAERLADALDAVAGAAVAGRAPVEAAGRHPLTLISTALGSASAAVDTRAALVNLAPVAAARLLVCLRALLAGGYVTTATAVTVATTLAARNVGGLIGASDELVKVVRLAHTLPQAESVGTAASKAAARGFGVRKTTATPNPNGIPALSHPAVRGVTHSADGAAATTVGSGVVAVEEKAGAATTGDASPSLLVASEIVALVRMLRVTAGRWARLAADMQAASALTHSAATAADGSDAALLSASVRSYKRKRTALAHSAAFAAAEAAEQVRAADAAAIAASGRTAEDEMRLATERALRMETEGGNKPKPGPKGGPKKRPIKHR